MVAVMAMMVVAYCSSWGLRCSCGCRSCRTCRGGSLRCGCGGGTRVQYTWEIWVWKLRVWHMMTVMGMDINMSSVVMVMMVVAMTSSGSGGIHIGRRRDRNLLDVWITVAGGWRD